jgi:hypothetical protein
MALSKDAEQIENSGGCRMWVFSGQPNVSFDHYRKTAKGSIGAQKHCRR